MDDLPQRFVIRESSHRMRAELTSGPARYARYRREYLGWGIFALMNRCNILIVRSRTAMTIMALTVAAAAGSTISVGRQSQDHAAISSFVTAGTSKTCVYTKAGTTPRKVSLPPARVNTGVRYTAVLRTNLGNIVIGLLDSRAPCTVNSFVHLAEAGFFKNTQCHRLITAGIYVLQCGDPYATAKTKLTCSQSFLRTGTPGYQFASENLKGATYPAGTIAMANDGSPDSNGSQFFIVYKNSTSELTPVYTPFGAVSSGLKIVRNVAQAGYACRYPLAGGGAPREKIIINSVTIMRARSEARQAALASIGPM